MYISHSNTATGILNIVQREQWIHDTNTHVKQYFFQIFIIVLNTVRSLNLSSHHHLSYLFVFWVIFSLQITAGSLVCSGCGLCLTYSFPIALPSCSRKYKDQSLFQEWCRSDSVWRPNTLVTRISFPCLFIFLHHHRHAIGCFLCEY